MLAATGTRSADHGPILVVDDDEGVRLSLADAIADEGYKVATAADGVEALDYLRGAAVPPCLILLDLWMPRMDGERFRQEQLARDDWSGIPVVVITAADDGKGRAAAMRVAGFLRKPIDIEDLLRLLKANC